MKSELMWRFLKRLLTAPTFPDPEQTRAAYWLNLLLTIFTAFLIIDSIGILLGLLDQNALTLILTVNAIALSANLGILLLMRRGYVKIAVFYY